MVEIFVHEDEAHVGNHEGNVLGLDPAGAILYFAKEQIEPVVAEFAAVFLPADKGVKKTLIFIGVEVLDGLDGEVADEFDGAFAVDVNVLFDVNVDVIEGVHTNELGDTDDDFVDELSF